MKKVLSLFLVLLLAFSSVSISAFAEDCVIYLENGYYVVRTVEEIPAVHASSASDVRVKQGVATETYYDASDELVAIVTVYGTFEYDGSKAEAIEASYEYEEYNGWSFQRGIAYCSGASAIASVTFENPPTLEFRAVARLTCSPTGSLS